MNLSQRLWQANQDLAQAALHHPFVQGLYDGTLPKTKFAYYVGQDAFFLEAFARAYSVAAAKAPDWEGFLTFHDLAGGVLSELKLHGQYAQTWEVSLAAVQPGGGHSPLHRFLAGDGLESGGGDYRDRDGPLYAALCFHRASPCPSRDSRPSLW